MRSIKDNSRSAPPGYHFVPPDGGYGWVITAASIAIGMLVSIPATAIGLLLPDIVNETKTTTATAAWIPSAMFSVGLIAAPLNVLFMEKYSHRTSSIVGGIFASLGLILSYFGNIVVVLFLTSGVMFGIGFGMLSNSSTLILNLYFTRRYGQAMGYVMAGHSVSKLAFAPIIELLIERYDYQGVFLIMGAICLNCIPISMIFHPATPHLKLKPIENNVPVTIPDKSAEENEEEVEEALLENCTENAKKDPSSNKNELTTTKKEGCLAWCTNGPLKTLHFSLLKEPIFYMIFYANFICFMVSIYTSVFMPSLLLENGMTPMQAAVVQSGRSGGEVVGRIFVPWAQAQFKINLTGSYIFVCAIQAVLYIFLVFIHSFPLAMIDAILIGIISGGVLGLLIMMMVDCVGMHKMGALYSLIMFITGFISIGFGPMLGFLRDILGTFSTCFYIIAASLVINCVLWLVKPYFIKNTKPIKNKSSAA